MAKPAIQREHGESSGSEDRAAARDILFQAVTAESQRGVHFDDDNDDIVELLLEQDHIVWHTPSPQPVHPAPNPASYGDGVSIQVPAAPRINTNLDAAPQMSTQRPAKKAKRNDSQCPQCGRSSRSHAKDRLLEKYVEIRKNSQPPLRQRRVNGKTLSVYQLALQEWSLLSQAQRHSYINQ